MKRAPKTVLAWLLALTLAFSVLPIAALAQEAGANGQTLEEPESYNVTADATYTLSGDVEVMLPIEIAEGATLTLDLNGHDLRWAYGWVEGPGALVINGTNGGTIHGELFISGGKLTVNGGTWSGEEGSGWPRSITGTGNVEIAILDGVFDDICSTAEMGWSGISNLTIRGGTFQGNLVADAAVISNGTFSPRGEIPYRIDALTINGGTFMKNTVILSASINNGTFELIPWDALSETNIVERQAAGAFLVRAGTTTRAAAPVISCELDEQKVAKVTITGEGGDIYYSTDGIYSSSAGNWKKYTGPFAYGENGTICAYIVDSYGSVSNLAEQRVETSLDEVSMYPTETPDGFRGSVTVTIEPPQGHPKAEIRYTLVDMDTIGTGPAAGAIQDPEASFNWDTAKRYTGPIRLTRSTYVVAQAREGALESPIFWRGYTVLPGTDRPTTPGGGSNSSSGGGSSNTTTTTTTNKDGSVTQTTTNKKTGTVTETTTEKNGTRTVVETRKDGTVTTSVTVGRQAGSRVALPVETPRGATLSISGVTREIEVHIPVRNMTAGTVAVAVSGGGERILTTAIPGSGGLKIKLDGSATVRIEENGKTFTDVSGTHWAREAVDFVSSRELFNGTTAQMFAPATPMTRQMLMTVLARLDGADTSGDAYAKGIVWATGRGISDGSNPGGTISREQLATMLYRYAGSPRADAVSAALPTAPR